MSVQNESLDMKSTERKPAAPELEYKAASQDSLSMFFAAIGGAVLGMLATLLVLAVINGGTLNFTHPERLAVMEANLARVNENVGAVSQNVDIVAAQVNEARDQLADARSQVDDANAQLATFGTNVQDLQTSVGALNVTGQKFDTFVDAMDQALNSMRKLDGDTAAATTAAATTAAATTAAPAAEASAGAAPAAAKPILLSDPQVEPGNVAVLFFVDANANGEMDAAETNLVGIKLVVTDASGKEVGEYTSTDAGILVEKLSAGEYTFAIADGAGQNSLNEDVAVSVPADAAEGQLLYVPMAE